MRILFLCAKITIFETVILLSESASDAVCISLRSAGIGIRVYHPCCPYRSALHHWVHHWFFMDMLVIDPSMLRHSPLSGGAAQDAHGLQDSRMHHLVGVACGICDLPLSTIFLRAVMIPIACSSCLNPTSGLHDFECLIVSRLEFCIVIFFFRLV